MDFPKSPPAAAIGELKAHLRLEDGAEDVLLAGWLRAATEMVEAELGYHLITRSWQQEQVIRSQQVSLSAPSGTQVTGIEVASEGVWHAVDMESVHVTVGVRGGLFLSGLPDGSVARFYLKSGVANDWNGLSETFRQAVIRLAAHSYTYRDDAGAAALPVAVRDMLRPYKRIRLL